MELYKVVRKEWYEGYSLTVYKLSKKAKKWEKQGESTPLVPSNERTPWENENKDKLVNLGITERYREEATYYLLKE